MTLVLLSCATLLGTSSFPLLLASLAPPLLALSWTIFQAATQREESL